MLCVCGHKQTFESISEGSFSVCGFLFCFVYLEFSCAGANGPDAAWKCANVQNWLSLLV